MIYRFYSNHEHRITIVGKYENGVMKVSAARCGDRDKFVRKIGRAIAEGRVNKDRLVNQFQTHEMTSEEWVAYAEEMASRLDDICEHRLKML